MYSILRSVKYGCTQYDAIFCFRFVLDDVRKLFSSAGFQEEQNLQDKRLQVNRGRQLKMYRVWTVSYTHLDVYKRQGPPEGSYRKTPILCWFSRCVKYLCQVWLKSVQWFRRRCGRPQRTPRRVISKKHISYVCLLYTSRCV